MCISDFLNDRTWFVRIKGGVSESCPIISSVPQGTVLGPVLFLMRSDISQNLETNMVFFADDAGLFNLNYSQSDFHNKIGHLQIICFLITDNKKNHISYSYDKQCSKNIYFNPSQNLIINSEWIYQRS